jgi:hypothetical protein
LGLVSLLGSSDSKGVSEVGGCEGASEVGGCETGVPFSVSDVEMLCEPEIKQSIILLSTER